jgi:hypothetical protein
MALRLSAFAPAVFYSQEDFWYSFLSEAESIPKAIVRLKALGKLKTSYDLIGN